jgi:tetratricopeptide (TPR) repeat protein
LEKNQEEKLVENRKAGEIIRVEKFIDKGKFEEALILLSTYEQKEDLSYQDKASCYLLQCQILFWQGKYSELITHAEQAFKESEGLENDYFKFDILLLRAYALQRLFRFEESFDMIKQGEGLFKTIPKKLTEAYKQRKADLAFTKGNFFNNIIGPYDADLSLEYLEYSLALREELGIKHKIAESLGRIAWNLSMFKGELDRALKYAERSIDIAKESSNKYQIAFSLNILGIIYYLKGEIDQSTINFEQSLELFKELNNKQIMAVIFNNLSSNYKERGELARALECIERSMKLNRNIGRLGSLAINHDFLIQILIDKGDLERAQISLNDLEGLSNQLKGKFNLMYLLDKALILKTSLRARDRVKAEEILAQLLKNDDLDYEKRSRALLALCDLLLTELRMTNDLEVLDELKQFIGQLSEIAENSHSYWIMGETYLLQAKLALLSLDLKKARRLLTKGQQIAERYGLNLLAIKISNEHDELLKQLNMWETLKESSSSLKERIEFSRLNEQMENMIRKRVVEVPELSDEEPVLLLIVSEGGRPIFSQSFVEDRIFEDYLFGGFFTTINSFITETFSEGLERATFGEYTLLMNSVSSFLMCYVFKGKSYSAQTRIRCFIDKLQNDGPIWQAFQDFNKLHKEIELKDIPSLEPLIKEIFMDKTILLN